MSFTCRPKGSSARVEQGISRRAVGQGLVKKMRGHGIRAIPDQHAFREMGLNNR